MAQHQCNLISVMDPTKSNLLVKKQISQLFSFFHITILITVVGSTINVRIPLQENATVTVDKGSLRIHLSN